VDARGHTLLPQALRDGIAVQTAATSADCLDWAYHQRPELVVVDSSLANTFPDLLTVVARLMRTTPVPVVVLVDDDTPENIDDLLTVGAVDVMVKPVHWRLLRARLVRMVTDQATRARAEASAADQRAMVDALRSTAAALLDTLDLDTVLDRILLAVQRVVPAEAAHVLLLDDDTGLARIARSYGKFSQPPIWDEVKAYRLDIGQIRNLREIRLTGRALSIADTHQYNGWVNFPIAAWVRSHVAAPIRVAGATLGFLTLESSTPATFTPADADQLQALADQAGVALRNVRLYEQIKRQTIELEERIKIRTLELQREREQLRAILDAMTEGVAYVELRDPKAPVIRYINPALTQITGWTFNELQRVGLEIFRAVDLDHAAFRTQRLHVFAQLSETGLYRHEDRFTRKNGSVYDAALITSRINDIRGRLIGAVLVLRDISQQKALEAQKSRFVSHASHELRTPLTNLKTRLYLIRKQPDQLFHHLRVMEDVTDRMKRLVEDLLDMTRFERGGININPRQLLLQDLLYDTVSVQQPEAERRGLILRTEIEGPPLLIHADPERLIQVVTNLLTNAINYTPSGGRITVRAFSGPTSADLASLGKALVQVEDTGVGIAPEHLGQIFQPFYRIMTQIRGTGLGLSIAREIIHLHGGTLTVESEVGQGSRFTFTLPLLPASVDADRPVEQGGRG